MIPFLFFILAPFAVETVASGITFPTSMAFVDNQTMLVLEKDTGIVKMVDITNNQVNPILNLNVSNQGERGLLGIAVSDKYVFLYLTELNQNRLYRYEWLDNKLINPELLLDLPATPGPNHNGGNIEIGPDNNVYLSVGNLNHKELEAFHTKAENVDTQKMDGRAGILQITPDGQSTYDYYAYGIRNSFGMDFDPLTQKLWDTENGPAYGDEINLVEQGFNSGWRQVQGIWKPQDGLAGETNLTPNITIGKYSAPEYIWNGTVGPTEIEFLNSDKYGEQYRNDLFVGSVNNNGTFYHFELNESRTGILSGEIFGQNFGGITDIEVGPDGYLYILAIKNDKIFRLR